MLKRDLFLTRSNKLIVSKELVNTFGQDSYNLVPKLMELWPPLQYVDSYESLDKSLDTELQIMNTEFIKQYSKPKPEPLPKLETVADYQNMDIPKPKPIIIDTTNRRGIPLRVKQGMHSRHIDLDPDIRGRSLENGVRGYGLRTLLG